MLKEENIRAFEDDELIKRYEKWEEHFFDVIIIIHDEILRRGFEINKEVEEYIKSQIRKIRREYKNYSNKELKEEYRRLEDLSYYNQVYLEKEIKNRKIRESSIFENESDEGKKYFLKSNLLILLIFIGIGALRLALHAYFGKMNLLNEGYLRVENYFFDFINTIPLIMLFQINGNYKNYYAKTKKVYHVTLHQVFYMTIFIDIIELIFTLISELNLYVALGVVLFFIYKALLVPAFIVDGNMTLPFAVQSSMNFTKQNPRITIKLFLLFIFSSILIFISSMFGSLFLGLVGTAFRGLILCVSIKIYFKIYNKK